MINTIYLENDAAEHSRTKEVLSRFPKATVVPCNRYAEVFNPKAQNFRLQKKNPALILAIKHGRSMIPAPPGYAIGHRHNYYFSHLANCLYDCRYCYLQGQYRSANYLLFVNYEHFEEGIDATLATTPENESVCFFSGYDCDSLALESITGFARRFLPFFANRPRAHLELRTKSVAIRPLLDRPALKNVVVAFSFTPARIADRYEKGTPSAAKRLEAAARLARAGWPVGLRFDPLIWEENFTTGYECLIDDVFAAVPPDAVHSVSFGPLRFPTAVHQRIRDLYPDEPLLAAGFGPHRRLQSYSESRELEMVDVVNELVTRKVPSSRVFRCEMESAP